MRKPLTTLTPEHKKKKLIIFDLDGTLAETKSYIDGEMSKLLAELLRTKRIAVIGGGRYAQFKIQLLARFHPPRELLGNLFLFPTTATSFYRYRNGWKRIYEKKLSRSDTRRIRAAFRDALEEVHYVHPKQTYGKVLENRGTQFTFSALGQDVVALLGERGVKLKKEWRDTNTPLKLKIARAVQRRLPHLEVHAAGYTSIDVTRKGIDKEYGVRQIHKGLHIPLRDMLFVGDALFKGGNDAAALRTGIPCIAVTGPRETKKIIRALLV